MGQLASLPTATRYNIQGKGPSAGVGAFGGSYGGGHGASAGVRPGSSRGGGGGKPVKVVLCQQYSQAGTCERGDGCQFAHGLQELQLYRTRQVSSKILGLIRETRINIMNKSKPISDITDNILGQVIY